MTTQAGVGTVLLENNTVPILRRGSNPIQPLRLPTVYRAPDRRNALVSAQVRASDRLGLLSEEREVAPIVQFASGNNTMVRARENTDGRRVVTEVDRAAVALVHSTART
jgi:hypothetical protein